MKDLLEKKTIKSFGEIYDEIQKSGKELDLTNSPVINEAVHSDVVLTNGQSLYDYLSPLRGKLIVIPRKKLPGGFINGPFSGITHFTPESYTDYDCWNGTIEIGGWLRESELTTKEAVLDIQCIVRMHSSSEYTRLQCNLVFKGPEIHNFNPIISSSNAATITGIIESNILNSIVPTSTSCTFIDYKNDASPSGSGILNNYFTIKPAAILGPNTTEAILNIRVKLTVHRSSADDTVGYELAHNTGKLIRIPSDIGSIVHATPLTFKGTFEQSTVKIYRI